MLKILKKLSLNRTPTFIYLYEGIPRLLNISITIHFTEHSLAEKPYAFEVNRAKIYIVLNIFSSQLTFFWTQLCI